ncbi:MAG: 3-isopropylmalate dehydratase small subunit [Woeseiaceae bacterium]
MQPVRQLKSRTVVLPARDVDTDQIIPARFLTTTSREGLGRHLFHDWRYAADGAPNPDFVLNAPGAKDCSILVTGNNFGCGSSREHAPWALLDYGIRAVVSTEIADIFRSNALKNGLLPIVVNRDVHEFLLQRPGEPVEIDLPSATLTLSDGRAVEFPIDGFARHCLVEGIDQLGFLQQHIDDIARFEETRAWMP